MSQEGPCKRAAGKRLENRRFDLDEVLAVHEGTHRANECCAQCELPPAIRAGHELELTARRARHEVHESVVEP